MTNEKKQSINDKVSELEGLLGYFEEEKIDLDEAIEKYEKAVKLVGEVTKFLKGYETKIEKIETKGQPE